MNKNIMNGLLKHLKIMFFGIIGLFAFFFAAFIFPWMIAHGLHIFLDNKRPHDVIMEWGFGVVILILSALAYTLGELILQELS